MSKTQEEPLVIKPPNINARYLVFIIIATLIFANLFFLNRLYPSIFKGKINTPNQPSDLTSCSNSLECTSVYHCAGSPVPINRKYKQYWYEVRSIELSREFGCPAEVRTIFSSGSGKRKTTCEDNKCILR